LSQKKAYPVAVAKRVFGDVMQSGFIDAGNLAYLSLLTLFPFFIVVANFAGSFGRTQEGLEAVQAFLRTLPPDVASLLAKPIYDVIGQRGGGGILTFGILVGLWTTANFVEAMRDIVRRAYKTVANRPFWQYRLTSMGLIVTSVVMMLSSFVVQVLLTGLQQFIATLFPFAGDLLSLVQIGRFIPPLILFGALFLLFYSLTPHRYRECPKWPGAALTTATWMGTTALLPVMLGLVGGYDLTYGSLAGVIIALLFFYTVGLGFVIGAQLNAALAEVGAEDEEPAAA
jgi:membrane protein